MIKYVFNPFTGNFDAIYVSSGGSQTPWTSNIDGAGYSLKNFFISKTSDVTAKFVFDVSALSTATTRTIVVPNYGFTLDKITTGSKTSGTGFLKGNGSSIIFDSSTYLTTTSFASVIANYIPYTGATTNVDLNQKYIHNIHDLAVHKYGTVITYPTYTDTPGASSFMTTYPIISPSTVSGSMDMGGFSDDGSGNLYWVDSGTTGGSASPYSNNFGLNPGVQPGSISGDTAFYGSGMYDDGSGNIYNNGGGNIVATIDYSSGNVIDAGSGDTIQNIYYTYSYSSNINFATIDYATGYVTGSNNIYDITYTYQLTTPIDTDTFTVDNDGNINTPAGISANGNINTQGSLNSSSNITANGNIVTSGGYGVFGGTGNFSSSATCPTFYMNNAHTILMRYDGTYSPRIAFDASFDSDSYGNVMVVDYQDHLGGSYGSGNKTLSIFQIGKSGNYGFQFIGLASGYSAIQPDMQTAFGITSPFSTPVGSGWLLGVSNGGALAIKAGGEIIFAPQAVETIHGTSTLTTMIVPQANPNMPTADPVDGTGTLWYDTSTNIVYRGT